MTSFISRFATCAALALTAVVAPAVGQTALAAPVMQSNGCTEEGYFPHENDIKKFYRCYEEDGIMLRADFDCPPGTVYDTDLPPGHCNHPFALNPNNKAYEDPMAD